MLIVIFITGTNISVALTETAHLIYIYQTKPYLDMSYNKATSVAVLGTCKPCSHKGPPRQWGANQIWPARAFHFAHPLSAAPSCLPSHPRGCGVGGEASIIQLCLLAPALPWLGPDSFVPMLTQQ